MKNIKIRNFRKEELKEYSGITLIALVITIIVLLILAGVALATLTGDSGILNNAENAKENTNVANLKEKVQIAVQGTLINGLGREIEEESFQKELDNVFGEGVADLSYDETEKTYTVIVNGHEISVTNKGNVGEPIKSNITVKLSLSHSNTTLNADTLTHVSEVTSENVPIPEGFYRVGGTKNTGVVISDVEGDDLNNTKKGNQFVWVPVNQNQKLTLDITSKEEITGITLVVPDGIETELTPSEKTSHSQEIEMTTNGIYEVRVKTVNETKVVQKRVRSLYKVDTELEVLNALDTIKYLTDMMNSTYKTAEEFKEANGKTIEEFAQEKNVTVGQYMKTYAVYIEELEEELKITLRKSYQNYPRAESNQNNESVAKYGGFYIARFEAGDGETESARTDASLDTNKLVSQKGAYVYNHVTWGTAKGLAEGMDSSSEHITSELINATSWDRTLDWLIETGMNENFIVSDSTSWGNYSQSTGNAAINSGASNMNYTTGRSEYWKANNIYDLAGNLREWFQDNDGTNYRLIGGNYTESGDIGLSSCVSQSIGLSSKNSRPEYGFRVLLFINE